MEKSWPLYHHNSLLDYQHISKKCLSAEGSALQISLSDAGFKKTDSVTNYSNILVANGAGSSGLKIIRLLWIMLSTDL